MPPADLPAALVEIRWTYGPSFVSQRPALFVLTRSPVLAGDC